MQDIKHYILPDGRVAVDAVELAATPTEGIYLKDYPDHTITVRTRNTTYRFTPSTGRAATRAEWIGLAMKDDGSEPRYLPFEMPVHIHGSTWGGSMIKMGYVGIDMHLELSIYPQEVDDVRNMIRTSPIQQIIVTPGNVVSMGFKDDKIILHVDTTDVDAASVEAHYWGTKNDWKQAESNALSEGEFVAAMNLMQ